MMKDDRLIRELRDLHKQVSMMKASGEGQDFIDQRLKTERQRLYALLDWLPAFVYLLAADHTIRFANRCFRKHFGDPEGRRCYTLFWGRTKACEQCITFRVFQTGAPQEWEWSEAPDGRTYQIYDYPFTASDGSLLVLEMGIDISRLKQQEDELRTCHHQIEEMVAQRTRELADTNARLKENIAESEQLKGAIQTSEERFKVIFDESHIGIEVFDIEGRLIDANKACLSIFGITDPGDMKWFSLFDDPHLPDRAQETLRKGAMVRYETPFDFDRVRELQLYTTRRSGIAYLDMVVTPLGGNGSEGPSAYLVQVQDISERKRAETLLNRSKEELEKKNIALEEKNIALREIISQIDIEKEKIKGDVCMNVNKVLLPIIKKLHIKDPSSKYIDLLERHLADLTSSFGHKIGESRVNLTPRETEICSMLKCGLSSRDVSNTLNISCQTVERHRKNIRKKLGLLHSGSNLISYLQNI